jgi:hypothetical protein
MNKTSFALLGILILALPFCSGKGHDVTPVVVLAVGDIQVKSRGADFAPAAASRVLMKGDVIKTGEASHITFQIGGSGIVHMAPDSIIEASSLFESGNAEILLVRGTVISRIIKLARGADFSVRIPITIASVRGTIFSVSYDNGAGTVGVSRGRVQVTHLASAKAKQVIEGKAADIRQEITIRDLTRREMLVLRKVEIFDPIEGAQAMDPGKLEKKGRSHLPEIEKIDREIEGLSPMTLESIRARYGKIDVVTLYSGKVYRGAILSRGTVMRMITAQGTVSIPSQSVKTIQIQ